MPKLAKDVTIRAATSGENVLLIDGEPFPWIVANEDIDVIVPAENSLGSVTLKLYFDGNLHAWSK